jgi:hypothetical protein
MVKKRKLDNKQEESESAADDDNSNRVALQEAMIKQLQKEIEELKKPERLLAIAERQRKVDEEAKQKKDAEAKKAAEARLKAETRLQEVLGEKKVVDAFINSANATQLKIMHAYCKSKWIETENRRVRATKGNLGVEDVQEDVEKELMDDLRDKCYPVKDHYPDMEANGTLPPSPPPRSSKPDESKPDESDSDADKDED